MNCDNSNSTSSASDGKLNRCLSDALQSAARHNPCLSTAPYPSGSIAWQARPVENKLFDTKSFATCGWLGGGLSQMTICHVNGWLGPETMGLDGRDRRPRNDRIWIHSLIASGRPARSLMPLARPTKFETTPFRVPFFQARPTESSRVLSVISR